MKEEIDTYRGEVEIYKKTQRELLDSTKIDAELRNLNFEKNRKKKNIADINMEIQMAKNQLSDILGE